MLQLKNLIRAAFKSILKNRMRSLLTSLGIIIGVCAVIVMVGIGQGSQALIKKQMDALGTNVIVVFPGASRIAGVSRGAGSWNTLTLDDVDAIQKGATLISDISPVINTGAQIIGGGKNWSTRILGVNPQYFDIRGWNLHSGEMFTDRDVRSSKKVAILGKTVADALFPDQDPIGEKIQIRNTPFTVIGVLKSKGQNPMGMDEDDIAMAPSNTVLYRLKGGRYIDMINISAVTAEQIQAAQAEITSLLRESHKIKIGDDDNFTVRNQAEITEAASATAKVMTLLLGSIAAVSLIVGGIGIMNIMLVSVTERTREIGIRLSVGARDSDILLQFLAEAIVLSLIGGILGIALAFCISFVLNSFTTIKTVIRPEIIFLAFSFAGTVGVFFGFHPARKAAGLNPIDALRYE